ncbi:MAG: phospholipase D-like domain-containing protein [Methylophilus sp.]
MSRRVAFKVQSATLNLHLDKGRQWSPVEHLLLYSVCDKPQSASEIAMNSELPWRVVIEVMIRLMRVGWIELVTTNGAMLFRGTIAGSRVVNNDVLPAVIKPITRRASFSVDLLSNTIFKSWELNLYSNTRFERLNSNKEIPVIQSADSFPNVQLEDIYNTLLEDDETFRAADPSGARFTDRYAVVTVNGNKIEGLPPRASDFLKQQILKSVRTQVKTLLTNEVIQKPVAIPRAEIVEIMFNSENIILGGNSHKILLERLIKKATSRLIIHSTFIDTTKFISIFPLLKQAALRGVKIDILWGKSTDSTGENSTRDAVESCKDLLHHAEVSERIRIHNTSTDSHSKILIADNGQGRWVCAIGSCNWLSSNFDSFEVSAYLDDPLIVSKVIATVGEMASPKFNWGELTRDLSGIAANIKKDMTPKYGIRTKAQLVFGSSHNDYVLKARDIAKNRIVIASHRLSSNADTLVFTPASKAVEAHKIDVTIYYGRTSGHDEGIQVIKQIDTAKTDGIAINQILEPRVHAKFLAWDDNDIVITSQNWLSSDPPESNNFSEIGIFLSGNGLARELIEKTKHALETY